VAAKVAEVHTWYPFVAVAAGVHQAEKDMLQEGHFPWAELARHKVIEQAGRVVQSLGKFGNFVPEAGLEVGCMHLHPEHTGQGGLLDCKPAFQVEILEDMWEVGLVHCS